jgi:hypothetical protein
MEKKLKLLFGVIGLILILIITLAIIIPKINTGNNPRYVFNIDADKSIIRVGEIVNLTIEGHPSGSNITWEIDENTLLYGEKIAYSFPISLKYNITININDGSNSWKTNKTVSVYHQNELIEFVGFPITTIRPNRANTFQIDGEIKSGITEPVFFYTVTIPRTTAIVAIELWVQGENEMEYIHTQRELLMNNAFTFKHVVYPIDYNIINKPISIYANFILEEGTLSGFNVLMEIQYWSETHSIDS